MPKSSATWATDLPVSRTTRTAPSRKTWSYFLRISCFSGIASSLRDASTEMGDAQPPMVALARSVRASCVGTAQIWERKSTRLLARRLLSSATSWAIRSQGFTYDGCLPFRGNELHWTPIWVGNRRAEELRGQIVRLQPRWSGGRLYAIRGAFVVAMAHDAQRFADQGTPFTVREDL